MSGVLGNNELLPSERALEQEFGVHRATVRRALTVLADEGLIERGPKGRFQAGSRKTAPAEAIAFMVGDQSDTSTRTMIADGVIDWLHETRSSLKLVGTNFRFELEATRDHMEFSLERLAGLILRPARIVAFRELTTAQRLIPMVVVDIPVPGLAADFVGCDDIEGGFAAAKHLYEMGHRRLAFVGDIVPETVQYRKYGFDKFCREAGIRPLWDFATFESFTALPHELQDALIAIPSHRRPTAAVCANDETAADLYSFLGKRQMKVPDDLALVGFGGAQKSLINALGLTTMEQPWGEVGRQAARLLLERLSGSGEGPFQEVRLRMKLSVGSSSGSALGSSV